MPIGLVRDSKNVYDDHQVLAIGYGKDEDGDLIYVYDPNCPNKESTIHITFDKPYLSGKESCSSPKTPPLRGFFCETYVPHEPPEIT